LIFFKTLGLGEIAWEMKMKMICVLLVSLMIANAPAKAAQTCDIVLDSLEDGVAVLDFCGFTLTTKPVRVEAVEGDVVTFDIETGAVRTLKRAVASK